MALILLGGYLAYERYWKKGNPEDSTKSKEKVQTELIIDARVEKIKNITVINDAQVSINFVQKSNNLALETPLIKYMDKDVIDRFKNSITKLASQRQISNDANNLEAFGLNKARVLITINLSDGTSKVLLIGNETPSKTGYYVKTSDKDMIYSISQSDAENLLIDNNKLKTKKIFDFEAKNVNLIDFKNGKTVVFETMMSDPNKWEIIKPLKQEADKNKVETLIDKSLGLQIKEYVDQKPDSPEYGLQNPRYILEIDANQQKHELMVGRDKVRNQEAYAKLGDTDDVFIIDTQSFDFETLSIDQVRTAK